MEGNMWTVKLFEMNFSDTGSPDSYSGILGGSIWFALYRLRNDDSVPSNISVLQSLLVDWKAVWFCCSILTSVTQGSFAFGLVICFC